MAGRLSSGAVAAGLIGLRKPSGGGGGGSAYDVSPPAATSEAVAAGSSLSAKTFGSFTGADAASIDGYTLRTVNASGSTSWSGSGLGPWTPSGDADGSAGVIALDATIGGVVVATALHDYARAAAAASDLETLIDFGSVNYNFLTTGGTSGTGGEGPHTVNGHSLTLSFNGTSGPDSLAFVSGVLQHVGNVSTKQAYIIVDLGADVSDVPFVANVSTDNLGASSGQSFIYRIAKHSSPGAQDDTMGALFGFDGAADDTSILFREAINASSYDTIEQVTSITDISTTPTRVANHVMGGAMLISFDQGTAALPTDGQVLSRALVKHVAIGTRIATPQNRRYLHLFCLENVHLRCNVRKLVIA